MPHASVSPTGFQALILCGPGESLSPFNSNSRDFPKSLLPLANRPLIWYPLEWCHRLGITNITLITPPESYSALDAALSQNPYLTSLPSPKATLLAPKDLDLTTGTAELFRLPEVQDAITGDFIVLPCDLLCEMDGRLLLEQWMTLHGDLSQSTLGGLNLSKRSTVASHNYASKKGGLGVWYETRVATENLVGAKKEETDFLATTPIKNSASTPSSSSLRPRVYNVVMAMPTDTLNDKLEEEDSLRIRRQLIKKHGCVRMLTTHRDAHIYFFPYWFRDYLRRNETFESLGEDGIGWWAKAGWQTGLARKLQFDEVLRDSNSTRRKSDPSHGMTTSVLDEIDLKNLSSTGVIELDLTTDDDHQKSESGDQSNQFASRVTDPPRNDKNTSNSQSNAAPIPSFHTYLNPSHNPEAPFIPLIRRIDTAPLLLSASLYLARLLPTNQDLNPLASSKSKPTEQPLPSTIHSHSQKHHTTSSIPQQATIDPITTLIDANCTLSPRITIKDAVIGANCHVASGARINKSVLMEGVRIEEKCVISDCVLGRGVMVGKSSQLNGCYVEHGYVVAEGTLEKGNILAGFAEGGGLGDESDASDLDNEDDEED